jgi:hypothetical protein
MDVGTPRHHRSVRTENLLRRVVFRGARPVAWSRCHILVEVGARRATIPTFDSEVPDELVGRIDDDLGLDLWRPPTR